MALPITLCHIVLYKPYGILESESEQLVLNIQARSQHLFASNLIITNRQRRGHQGLSHFLLKHFHLRSYILFLHNYNIFLFYDIFLTIHNVEALRRISYTLTSEVKELTIILGRLNSLDACCLTTEA